MTRAGVASGVWLLVAACGSSLATSGQDRWSGIDWLSPCPERAAGALCGSYVVAEDRSRPDGRKIALAVVVLPAEDPDANSTPLFWLHGGPGAAATELAAALGASPLRGPRDIVLVDQRGTGASNPLYCTEAAGNDDDLQGYLELGFSDLDAYAACRDRLSRIADLSLYSSPIAADDLDEVRAALGYERINLWGGSYGSRMGLVFMRAYPNSVRAAVLTGVASIAFRNPLYHAASAQQALDATLAECAADARCSAAFPDLRNKLSEVLQRLDTEPAPVTVSHPVNGTDVQVMLSRAGFAEGLRVFSYYMPRARRVPALIERAWQGDYRTFAETVIESNRDLNDALAHGMLLSVTCAEDVARIDPAEVEPLTRDTYYGDQRVRTQLAVCELWPRSSLPENYGDPVTTEAPVLLFSGTLDPVTAPEWAAEAASHLPNALHVVVPGAHGVRNSCTLGIAQSFLRNPDPDSIDTACVSQVQLPPFELR